MLDRRVRAAVSVPIASFWLVLGVAGCSSSSRTLGSDGSAVAMTATASATPTARSASCRRATGRTGAVPLPDPTGPYSVASQRYRWIDASRLEGGSEDPNDHRELYVQVYYPVATAGGPRRDYVRGLSRLEPWLETADIEKLRRVEVPVAVGLPMLRSESGFPVVLFAHGWQSRSDHYTALLSDIASYGYVVAAIDQPYQGRIVMSDGRVTEPSEDHFVDPMAMVRYYGDDFDFVLQQLSGVDSELPFDGGIDTDRAFAMGHSNGAVAALAAAAASGAFGGVVAIDSWDPAFERVFALAVPLLLVRTAAANGPTAEYLATVGGLDVALSGLEHASASDWPFLDAEDDSERSAAVAALGRIREVVTLFFRGVDESSLDELPDALVDRAEIQVRIGSTLPGKP